MKDASPLLRVNVIRVKKHEFNNDVSKSSDLNYLDKFLFKTEIFIAEHNDDIK